MNILLANNKSLAEPFLLIILKVTSAFHGISKSERWLVSWRHLGHLLLMINRKPLFLMDICEQHLQL